MFMTVKTHEKSGIEFHKEFLFSETAIDLFFDSITPTEMTMLKAAQSKGVVLTFQKRHGFGGYFTMVKGDDGEQLPILNITDAGCYAQESSAILYHELIHVEQWVRGDLVFNDEEEKILWNEVYFDPNVVAYKDLPYEVEAWDRQFEFLKLTGKLNKRLPDWMNRFKMEVALGLAFKKAERLSF